MCPATLTHRPPWRSLPELAAQPPERACALAGECDENMAYPSENRSARQRFLQTTRQRNFRCAGAFLAHTFLLQNLKTYYPCCKSVFAGCNVVVSLMQPSVASRKQSLICTFNDARCPESCFPASFSQALYLRHPAPCQCPAPCALRAYNGADSPM